MGSVYLARDRRIGRRVALKVIHLAPSAFEDSTSAGEFFGRLQREAEVGGALQHPNIVALYDVGYEDGRVSYLAMEYVEGETLLDLQRRSGGIVSQDQLRRIAGDVLRGLEYAHAKGIIHRDIKPANILIAGDGSAKIADFGIARPLESSMTRIGSLMGTPNYMSPEQAAGIDPSPKSDIFSLGVTLYDAIAGSKPFAAADLPSILNNIINQPVPPLPSPLGTLVAQMMSKSPDDRPTASQALARLNARTVVPQDPLLWIVAAACIAIAAGSFLIPEPTLPRADPAVQQLHEKRRELAEAQALFDNGKFAESLQKFDAYLQKYPASTVARDGRDRAREAMGPKPASKHKRSRRDEDISPRELLRRLKKAIRGK